MKLKEEMIKREVERGRGRIREAERGLRRLGFLLSVCDKDSVGC